MIPISMLLPLCLILTYYFLYKSFKCVLGPSNKHTPCRIFYFFACTKLKPCCLLWKLSGHHSLSPLEAAPRSSARGYVLSATSQPLFTCSWSWEFLDSFSLSSLLTSPQHVIMSLIFWRIQLLAMENFGTPTHCHAPSFHRVFNKHMKETKIYARCFMWLANEN